MKFPDLAVIWTNIRKMFSLLLETEQEALDRQMIQIAAEQERRKLFFGSYLNKKRRKRGKLYRFNANEQSFDDSNSSSLKNLHIKKSKGIKKQTHPHQIINQVLDSQLMREAQFPRFLDDQGEQVSDIEGVSSQISISFQTKNLLLLLDSQETHQQPLYPSFKKKNRSPLTIEPGPRTKNKTSKNGVKQRKRSSKNIKFRLIRKSLKSLQNPALEDSQNEKNMREIFLTPKRKSEFSEVIASQNEEGNSKSE